MRHGTFLLTIIVTGFILSACTSGERVFSNGAPQLVAAPDSVSAMLADAADRASNALETLAAVEHERTPTADLSPVANAPVELRRAVTVSWIGPVDTITKTLADRASYQFRTIGATPAIPVIINIDVENRPVIDVLRDIGLQLGNRADIKVDSMSKVVEIHYAPNTGYSDLL